MSSVFIEDYQMLGELPFIDWERFRDTTILVTGATGLIGMNLVKALIWNGEKKDLHIRILAPVRNVDAAKELFGEDTVEIFYYELGTPLPLDEHVDYIVHLASPTSSKYFMEKPADTLLANIDGTRALLQWAYEHPIKRFIMVSTMEVYGFPKKGHKVTEEEVGGFLPQNARNSYPIGKIATEMLCYSYYVQHDVPTVILRATQTFGPGVRYDDGRVFAQFMRCAIEGTDIVLRSSGLTERCYLYTADAVSAILTAIHRAENGNAYTVANPSTYCSIRQMAEMVTKDLSDGKISVKYDIAEDIGKLGYADTLYMDLDVRKLESLGWNARVGLKDMFKRMMRGVSEDA
ncbi:MAG: NAD(P)-dependent oxidoreductase [Clostridiales bacterium]|nr:NAD(P)-dependent oxidoreductase [Clostridiales bacterium]